MAIHAFVIARSMRRGDPAIGGKARTGLPRFARNDAKGFRMSWTGRRLYLRRDWAEPIHAFVIARCLRRGDT
jgi:hypothetical protein